MASPIPGSGAELTGKSRLDFHEEQSQRLGKRQQQTRPDGYLFLMRHAAHEHGELTPVGHDHIVAVGERLREWMRSEWREQPNRQIAVWTTTGAAEVRATAELLASSADLAEPLPVPKKATGDPALELALAPYSPDPGTFRKLIGWLKGEKSFVLLVGNDPLVGWLAHELCGHGVAFDKGELVCVGRRGTRWRVEWTVSADGPAETEAILAKVKSKTSTAAALGTVIVALTVFLLQNAVEKGGAGLQWLAFGALSASAMLYFATLFLYDALQMPPRYWASRFPASRTWLTMGRRTLARPPTSTARVLQVAMVQIWTRIFLPATVLMAVGIALLAVSATPSGRKFAFEVHPWHVVGVMAALAVGCGGWVASNRPDIGSTD